MKNWSKHIRTSIAISTIFMFLSSTDLEAKDPIKKISKDILLDKVKGGWAGQTIGTTFGWTNEFQYPGTYIQDYERIPWHNDYINEAMRVFPGLYDDVYMDLMFMNVFEKKGLDASMEDFAQAFSKTEFQLWHANQAGRYNVQNGISAEKAGHWLNNPHADDIDFQIEADFAGLMSPGLPQAATNYSEKIGKIVNSGDGLYGGIFVANMYSWAFISDDIPSVINNALKSIPKQSQFHQLISDVIKWHKKYPKDWKQTWFEIQKKWAEEVGCPTMVFHPLNIDAKINAAYVVMGLLYGEGDYTKTIEISTRTGQDSDCNPATALGILSTMIGYSKIPEYWKTPLQKAEDKKFSYSEYNLKDVYQVGFEQALENIVKYGGKVIENEVFIPKAEIATAAFEENFKGHFPKERTKLEKIIVDTISFEFEGIGFVLRGASRTSNYDDHEPIVAELYINNKKVETANLPWQNNKARADLFWKYQLPKGKHKVAVKVIKRTPNQDVYIADYLVYDDKKTSGIRFGGDHVH